MMVYPHAWVSKNGHAITISNPEAGVYNIDVITKEGKIQYYTFYSSGHPKILVQSGHLKNIELEIYVEWAEIF